jgi:hypothetical protein
MSVLKNDNEVIIASLAAEVAAMYYRSAQDRALYAINDELNSVERCAVDQCITECPACNVAYLDREYNWHIIDKENRE